MRHCKENACEKWRHPSLLSTVKNQDCKKKIPCRQQGTILINMITTVDLLIYILGTVRASPNLQGLWVKYAPGKYTQQADIKRKEKASFPCVAERGAWGQFHET